MRVLFLPMAWYSHYLPMVPLAWAFRTAGHDVRVGSGPALTAEIRQSGLPAVPLGRDYDFLADSFALQSKIRERVHSSAGVQTLGSVTQLPAELRQAIDEMRFGPYARLMESMVDDLVALTDDWRPDLVIADPFVYAAHVAAQRSGAPLVRQLWGPDFPWHLKFLPGLGVTGQAGGRDAWPASLLAVYDRFGIAPADDIARHTVDPSPARLQGAGIPNRLPMRYIPYNGPSTLPVRAAKRGSRRRVCVTSGVGMRHFLGQDGLPIGQITAALASLDVDVVVAVKGAGREVLPGLPADVEVIQDQDLQTVLATCDAIVHQGGGGMILNSILRGIPQLIVAQILDQIYNGERVAATGAGLCLSPGQADEASFKSAMSTLLFDDGPRQAAAELRQEALDQPAPARVAEELAALV
ncbi:nucleotide disphospho-sugar-binding domain-containing protein [Dactylosporangium sp. NPDC051541]|uniref:nucleotide disphospho-sugar-binding domain-containing protein n=1 Tax=Dactylosporangium sp. NPDC051541 TaxID=3363977 RepID=UPI0037BCF754